MSIHNIHKDLEGDRSNPRPNVHDVTTQTGTILGTIPRGSHNTLSTAYTSPGVVPQSTASLGQFINTGTITIGNTGQNESVTSVPHNLGYTPYVIGSLNNATISGGAPLSNVQVFLPTWANFGITGGNITFQIWLSIMADSTNVYVYCLNSTGSPVSDVVTYYLYKQPALQV